jgi:hypothetical protein
MQARQKILEYFALLKRFDTLATSYLFVGYDLLPFSLEVAKLINCQRDEYFCNGCPSCLAIQRKVCPDLLVVDEPSYIRIEQVRGAQRFLSLRSLTLKHKVLVMNQAHSLTEEAANAFLKTLEEPPASSFIVLTTSRLDSILPTIISRCRRIYLSPTEGYYQFNDQLFLERFLQTKNIEFKEREKANSFFLDLLVFLRDYMVFKLTKDKNRLLGFGSYEIISNLKVPLPDLVASLKIVLKIYNSLENVNINLAANLLELAFS